MVAKRDCGCCFHLVSHIRYTRTADCWHSFLALCQECDRPYHEVAHMAWCVDGFSANTQHPTVPEISTEWQGSALFMWCLQSAMLMWSLYCQNMLMWSLYCHHKAQNLYIHWWTQVTLPYGSTAEVSCSSAYFDTQKPNHVLKRPRYYPLIYQ